MSMSKKLADGLARVQIAVWIDGDAHCAVCGHIYESVDDFVSRAPRAGHGFQSGNPHDRFVDDVCFPVYEQAKRTGSLS